MHVDIVLCHGVVLLKAQATHVRGHHILLLHIREAQVTRLCPTVDVLLGEVSIQEVWDHLLECDPSTAESSYWSPHGLLDALPHRHEAVGGVCIILIHGELCSEAAPSGEHLPGALVGGGAEVAAHYREGVGVGGGGRCGSLLGQDNDGDASGLRGVFARQRAACGIREDRDTDLQRLRTFVNYWILRLEKL